MDDNLSARILAKLLDQMRGKFRTLPYSTRIEDGYVLWSRQFILDHRERHPSETGEKEVGESDGLILPPGFPASRRGRRRIPGAPSSSWPGPG